MKFNRVLLKLSGEALMPSGEEFGKRRATGSQPSDTGEGRDPGPGNQSPGSSYGHGDGEAPSQTVDPEPLVRFPPMCANALQIPRLSR